MNKRSLLKKVEAFREQSARELEKKEKRLDEAKNVVDSCAVQSDGKKHVLICDDQKLNGDLVRIFLNRKDIPSDYAKNGLEALDMFAKSPVGYYSTVLMDVRMPVMDGHKATKAIRELDRGDAQTVTIIAMTADASSEDIKRCNQAGMNSLIAKPVDQDELYEMIL